MESRQATGRVDPDPVRAGVRPCSPSVRSRGKVFRGTCRGRRRRPQARHRHGRRDQPALPDRRPPTAGTTRRRRETLAEAETAALKKPDRPERGQKPGLAAPGRTTGWRFQIPASPENDGDRPAIRTFWPRAAAGRDHVSEPDVTAAVERLPGPARDRRLEELANGQLPAGSRPVRPDRRRVRRQDPRPPANRSATPPPRRPRRSTYDALKKQDRRRPTCPRRSSRTASPARTRRPRLAALREGPGAGDPARVAAIARVRPVADAKYAPSRARSTTPPAQAGPAGVGRAGVPHRGANDPSATA